MAIDGTENPTDSDCERSEEEDVYKLQIRVSVHF
jgi:hypothetical protein